MERLRRSRVSLELLDGLVYGCNCLFVYGRHRADLSCGHCPDRPKERLQLLLLHFWRRAMQQSTDKALQGFLRDKLAGE